MEVKGIIGIRWGKENFDPFYLPLLRVSLPWSSELTIFDIIALSTGDPAPPNIPTMGPDRIKKMYSIPCTNVLPQILYYEGKKHVWRGGLFDEKGIYLIFLRNGPLYCLFFCLSCNSLRAVSLLLGNRVRATARWVCKYASGEVTSHGRLGPFQTSSYCRAELSWSN